MFAEEALYVDAQFQLESVLDYFPLDHHGGNDLVPQVGFSKARRSVLGSAE